MHMNFGDAGRQCAEIVLRWATTLFAVPLDVLNIQGSLINQEKSSTRFSG
jgi:hypothetical protein